MWCRRYPLLLTSIWPLLGAELISSRTGPNWYGQQTGWLTCPQISDRWIRQVSRGAKGGGRSLEIVYDYLTSTIHNATRSSLLQSEQQINSSNRISCGYFEEMKISLMKLNSISSGKISIQHTNPEWSVWRKCIGFRICNSMDFT